MSRGTKSFLLVGTLLIGCGAAPTPVADRGTLQPTVVCSPENEGLPADRTAAPPLIVSASTTAGDRAYARAAAIAFSASFGAYFEAPAMQRERQWGEAVSAAADLYFAAATNDVERAQAFTRLGDLHDLRAAAHVALASERPEGVPIEVAPQLVRIVADQGHDDYCAAAYWYGLAASRDASAARANAQLRAYGDSFLDCCHRPSLVPTRN